MSAATPDGVPAAANGAGDGEGRHVARSAAITGVAQVTMLGLGAVLSVVILLRFGKNSRTDGLLAAYGVYSVVVLFAQSFRTAAVARLVEGERPFAAFAVTDPGGHSSRPSATNPIYRLARDLDRLAAYKFPAMQSEITMAAFKAMAPGKAGPIGEALRAYVANPNDAAAIETLSADRDMVGQLRTTCVATMINGGHATNALPQKVTANINCRIFPGTPSEEVRKTIVKVLDDATATVERQNDGAIDAGPSPLRPDVLAAVTKAVHARYPGLPVLPGMSAGATDSMFFRALGVPAYGVAGVFMKSSDDFAHGLNERVPTATIDGALAQWESILKDLAK